MKGQAVVVTGAGHGIGRAIASKLSAEGARVVVNDLDSDVAHQVAAEIGGHAIPGDAASLKGVTKLVEATRALLGDVDAWYANAGIGRGDGLDASETDRAASFEVNTMAHVRAARLLVPTWIERGAGRFVVTASAAGLLTILGSPTYSVTEHGAVAFAKWLSATCRHRGIVVQAICPQGLGTQMLDESGRLSQLLGRDEALSPETVAQLVLEATHDDRFQILPHSEIAAEYSARASNPDGWLYGMNSLQRPLEERSLRI